LENHGHDISPTQLLASFFGREKKEIGVILVYGLGVGILSLVIPIGVQSLVGIVNFGAFSQPVLFLVLVVFAGLSAAAVLRGLQIVIVEQFQKRFFAQIALELAYRIPRLHLDGKNKARFPELINRFFDVLTVQKSGATLLLDGFALTLQIVLGLILLAFYHWFLLAFALILVAVIGIILFVLGKGAVNTSVQESVHKYRVAAWLEDLAARPMLFRTKASRAMALEKANEEVKEFLKARSFHFSIILRQVMGSLALQAIASSVLLGIGAYLVVTSQLTIGQLVAAEIVVTTALGSLAKFQKHLEAFYDLTAALNKLESLMDLPLEQWQGDELVGRKHPISLECKKVSFAFEGGDPLFQNLTFAVEPGERLAVLGSNSSGKSTLVDLFYGIRSATHGVISIDGNDLRDLSTESLREQIALVRGAEVLADSILENVRMGRDLKNDEIREALKSVGLLEEILKFPRGIQTELTGDGRPLSFAQVYQLILARAVVSKPRLLLLDETLDDLDDKSKEVVLELIFQKNAPWTLVIATHDKNLAKQCSQIIDLEKLAKGVA